MKRNTQIGLSLGIFVVLVLLAAGAYTAVRLLADEEGPPAAGGQGRVMQTVVDNGNGPVSIRTTFLPAPEVPDEPSAASGIVTSRQDNSVMIGTGNIDVSIEVQVDSETGQETRSAVPRTDGPEVEVVIGPETILYRDVTDFEADMPTESGERELQQVVRQVESADEIEPQMEMEVWGERRGDRINATFVIFRQLPGL